MDFPKQLGLPKYEFRLIFGKTRIEYDENKDTINREKNGYSLESAVYHFERLLLPLTPHPFITTDAFEEGGEIPHNRMGLDDAGNVVFLVTTMRDNETVRIISYRRADEKERQIFFDHTDYNKPE